MLGKLVLFINFCDHEVCVIWVSKKKFTTWVDKHMGFRSIHFLHFAFFMQAQCAASPLNPLKDCNTKGITLIFTFHNAQCLFKEHITEHVIYTYIYIWRAQRSLKKKIDIFLNAARRDISWRTAKNQNKTFITLKFTFFHFERRGRIKS